MLYCVQRRQIANAFTGTVFNRKKDEMLNENMETLKKNFFLQAITERKEKITQQKANISLFSEDIRYGNFRKMALSGPHFIPTDLEISGENRKIAREIVVEVMKKIAKISNSNLIRYADHLLSNTDIESVVQWVGKDSIRVDNSKYNTTYNFFSETIIC